MSVVTEVYMNNDSKDMLPLIVPKTSKPYESEKPSQETIYIIYAYNRVNKYWSKRGYDYTTYEKAKEEAKNLSRIWEYIRIIEIMLP
jgi:hypothetical protein